MQIYIYLFSIVIVLFAQMALQNKYQKYRKIDTHRQMKGFEVARMILDNHGLNDVAVNVNQRGGALSDHYNPVDMSVNLSPEVYYNSSIASVSVAAHEVGHAIQHAENYGLIGIRNRMLPMAQFASHFGWLAIMVGLFLSFDSFFYFGVALLIVILIFQVVTLPIEFDASKRALLQLEGRGIVYEDEIGDCKSMLSAAAFTYVAAMIATLAQILRILLMRGRRND